MSINGNGDTLTIKGARLKVSGGVRVSGSIAYTEDATGFGGVSAQIDGDDTTLNITAGKTSGVAKIERDTTANITGINHANVDNNTTIHIALKNTSDFKGDFVTIGTFANDGTVKVNYTDEYVIGPGETGMLTLRKVAGILSLFIREMFSSTATNTDTKPFYIKDGTNYKYPLYTTTGGDLTLTEEPINGVTYYRPSSGLKTKTRPPLGIPELIVTPTGNLAIGNDVTGTTVNYDVWGVPSSFDFGSIYQGSTKKVSFLLENGEASGSFTESGASSGDAYSLYVERTDVSTSDTTSVNAPSSTTPSTFGYTSAIQSYTVPSDVTNVRIKCWGAAGGNSTSYLNGGVGGYAQGDVEVTPGETLYVAVGQGGIGQGIGGNGSGAGMTGVLSVWNTSDVNATHDESIVIAGGGGGGGGNSMYGGNGGGDSGGDSSQTHHRPGTQTAGGNYLSIGSHGGSAGGDGVKFRGGKGGGGGQTENDSVWPNRVWGDGKYGSTGGGDGQNAAGGGGGYWGAAGGHDLNTNGGSAGGGSGYIGGGSTHTVSNGQNLLTSIHGSTSLPPNTTDSDYNSSAGKRGGSNGANGASGYVVIIPLAIGKSIPKVTGASFDSTNVTFTVQGSVTNITYTINGGSEQTTPVGTLAVAHSLSSTDAITVVAYAVDANGVQISTKKTVTGTIP